jgi:hypothetical protein
VALFFIADVITIAVLLMFPEIVTWLPNFEFDVWWAGLWVVNS